jgi:tetratricopeptide (TPR) repeat protein
VSRREPDSASLKTEIEAVFAKGRRARSPYGIASELATMLLPCLGALERMIADGRAAEAEALLKRIVTASESVMARIDDSNARFYPLCAQAVTLWGQAWARIEPRNPRKIAALVQEFVDEGAYSIRDRMIADFRDALGEQGLRELRDAYAAELAAIPQEDPDGPKSRSREACDRIRARHSLIAKLKAVADARRDVDGFIELCRLAGDHTWEGIAIGRRLVEAGRHEEALPWIDRAIQGDRDRDPDRPHDEPHGAAMIRALALSGLGRASEAAETLWIEFERRPCLSTLRDIDRFSAMPDADGPGIRRAFDPEPNFQRASATASRHANVHDALRFLMEAAEHRAAAELILARTADLDGHRHDVLVPMAEALAEPTGTLPAHAAWLCFRALLSSILADGRRNAYGHAAHYLIRMRGIAPRAELGDAQAALDAELAIAHRFKRSFWEAVADEEGAASGRAR